VTGAECAHSRARSAEGSQRRPRRDDQADVLCVRTLDPLSQDAGGPLPRCLARRRHAVVLVPVSDRPAALSRLRAGRLRIEAKAGEDRVILLRNGELDISSAPLLDETDGAFTCPIPMMATDLLVEQQGRAPPWRERIDDPWRVPVERRAAAMSSARSSSKPGGRT
jgi:hypothetical protein